MNVKSRVISKIDSLLSEYNRERNSGPVTPGSVKRPNAILGAISALEFLNRQIKGLDVTRFETMRIVETSESEIPTLRYAKGFLSQVLFMINITREYKRMDLRIGSGHHPDAVSGREEACDRMTEFVYELDYELADIP